MSNNRITPFVKRMRTNGGTIYTFSSAVEDIGLNINERNNVVKISNFALLNIPPINFDSGDLNRNFFNIKAIDGAFEYEAPSASIKDGRVLIAESFQNYALNIESNLLNREDYNPTLIRTVSERVFWKWLKETGAIRWSKDVSVGSKQYWSEEIDADGSLGYNSVVKYLGQVSAGNVRTDSFGTYNETYILVPTSHGQMDAYFEIVEDDNYYHGMEIPGPGEKILGRESYTLPHPDGLSYLAYYDFVDSSTWIVGPTEYTLQYDNSTGGWSDGWWYTAEGIEPSSTDNAYLTDSSIYLTSGIYNVDLQYVGGTDDFAFRRSKVDCLSLVFNLDELKGIYGDTELTYDKMAIQDSINDSFEFNAVLIYYTVWNSTQEEILGRNLLGILFLDAPSGNSQNFSQDGIVIPSLEKIQSGPSGFGTSYSLRLNIKTDNMVDDTGATIVDMATSDQLYAEDWTAAFANLNTAVNLLTQNNSIIQGISENYIEVQTTQTQILNDLQALQYQVNDIGRDIQGTPNTLALFADGDDPLVDSSVYMKFGNVGIKNALPQYPLHVSGTTKLDEVIIQNAVRDTSNNIILGYGSPLQLGASTNYREVDIYTGNSLPGIHVDTSNNIILRRDVSILGKLSVDGSTRLSYLSVDKITSDSFNFDKSYIADSSVGSQFGWENGYLKIIAESDVSAAGINGSIQFNAGGALQADTTDASGFTWDTTLKRLYVPGVLYLNWRPPGGISSIIKTGQGALTNIFSGIEIVGDPVYTDWGCTLTRDNGGQNGTTYLGHKGTGNLQIYAPQNGGVYVSHSNVGIKTTPHPTIALSVNGDVSLGSNIIGKNISWNSSSRSLTIVPGNTLAGVGTAKLGMVNYASANTESDYLYTGAIHLGGQSNFFNAAGTNGLGFSLKHYKTGNGQYQYAHIMAGDNGGLYSKISTNSNDAFAATLGTWRLHPYITGNVNDRILTATEGADINGESNLTFDGSTLSLNNGDKNIFLSDTTGTPRTLSIRSSNTNEGSGGHISISGGEGNDDGGNIYIKGGLGDGGINGFIQIGVSQTSRVDIGSAFARTNILGDCSIGGNLFVSGAAGATIKNNLKVFGDVEIDGDVIAYPGSISDIRLKDNIQKLDSPLDKILQIEGISYERRKTGERRIGIIAQELEKVMPEVVSEKRLPLETGGDTETLYKTVRYTEIIPYLIEAIKEQQKIIEGLREEINELKK